MSFFLQTELAWSGSGFHSILWLLRKLKTTKALSSGPIFQFGCPNPRLLVSAPPVSICNLFFKIFLLLCHHHPQPKENKVTYIKRHYSIFGKSTKAHSGHPLRLADSSETQVWLKFLPPHIPAQVSGLLGHTAQWDSIPL